VERSSTRLPEIAQEEAAKTQKTVDLNELMQSILEQAPSDATASPAQSPWGPIVGDTAQLSSDFGMRRDPFTRRMQHHSGIDLAVPTGTKVYPCKPGEVVFSGHKGGYGNVVVVRHEDSVESVYGHCSRNLVRTGQRVARNTVLALSGSSGRSTGPHLHFEVRVDDRAVNPMKMLREPSLEVAKAF
jgi:murein DD-endopeptidase MepM/ murein hydrolase activator NlpD